MLAPSRVRCATRPGVSASGAPPRHWKTCWAPHASPWPCQLEKCKSMAELQTKILELRTVVASMRSEKKAEEFVAAALGR